VKPLPLAIAALILAFGVWRWRKTSTEQKLIGLAIVAALAVYGSGQVHIDLESTIEKAGDTLGTWTYVLVGAMTFLETGAFLSFIAPGEFTILFGGLVAGQGKINVIILIGVVWFCAVLGDTTSFYLGRRLGRGWLVRHGERVKITEERLDQVERFYDKHGGITVFIGRFVGLLRALGPFIAGASKMEYRTFLPYDILGGGLWGTMLVLLGYIFWRSFDRLKTIVGQGFLALGALIAVVAGAIAAYRFFKVPENRAKASAWLDEQERKPVARPFVRGGRLVLNRVVEPVVLRTLPYLRFLWGRLTPGSLGLELTTLLAIAAVGTFAYAGLWIVVAGDPAHGIDFSALRRADELRNHTAVDIAKVVTWFGSFGVTALVTLATTAFLLARRRLTEALPLVPAFVITYVGVHVAKVATDRPRPLSPLVETAGSSFPSGHAAYAVAWTACAIAVVHAIPGMVRRALFLGVAMALTVAIALSRVYLRVHWLTDVLGGAGLGAAAFALCGVISLVVAFLRHNRRGQVAADPARTTVS
jgi:membrane protein DedA with SNARE-associated domain/membrane-associated phospholipid phosphatase